MLSRLKAVGLRIGAPVFTAAGLVLAIEPMLGKLLLPALGGSPATWAACLWAFQLLLLGGYAYAHVSTRYLGVRRQVAVHLALLAVASGRAVGVDVEALDRAADQTLLAKRWFSADEYAVIERLPAEQQGSAFLHTWVCKEAWLKATGCGLSRSLDSFDVSVEPGNPARLLATRPDAAEAAAWSLSMLDVGAGYLAAVAIEGPMPAITQHDWDSNEW